MPKPKPIMLPFKSKDDLAKAVDVLAVQPMQPEGKYFRKAGDCQKCGKLLVPVSYCVYWLCSECYEVFARSELGCAALASVHDEDQQRKYQEYDGTDDVPARLKGWRAR